MEEYESYENYELLDEYTAEQSYEDIYPTVINEEVDDVKFDMLKKKKKHRVIKETPKQPEDDYSYDFLLQRLFRQLKEPPKDIRIPYVTVGSTGKKSIITNMAMICSAIKRSIDHISLFYSTELGADTSINGTKQLVIRGKYSVSDAQSVLNKYVESYVVCNICRSRDTTQVKEHRVHLIKCNRCFSKRPTQPIKGGFRAQVAKRSQENE
jgi:translation initiation factor 2 subunit 2